MFSVLYFYGAYIFSSEFTYMSLVITICCLHMRQLMVDMYQSNHCEFSFSNKSDLLVYLYTHSDDGTSIHILLYSFHTKVSSGRRFRTHDEKKSYKCRYWRRVLLWKVTWKFIYHTLQRIITDALTVIRFSWIIFM